MNVPRTALCLIFATAAVAACSSSDTRKDDGSAALATNDCGIQIDRFKELEIIDDAVVNDARTKNETGGAWSFRHAVEELSEGDTSAFLDKWLNSFARSGQVNGFSVAGRTFGHRALVCPWLRSTPENECDATCTVCKTKHLDLAKAPFKLLAIANRLDLSGIYEGTAGEGRLVFGATSGPADLAANRRCTSGADTGCTLDMTVIFEYALPQGEGRDAAHWAREWHKLGAAGSFDDGYKASLQNVTDGFSRRGASPGRPLGGSAISQIRTNERIFEWDWELREFIGANGGLLLAATENTPDPSLNGSETLKKWLLANRDTVLTEKHEIPIGLLGGRAPSQTFKWHVDVDEPLRHAFARQTCNGCHQSEERFVDGNFHISPHQTGTAKLSAFLHDPADQTHDELSKRAAFLADVLCANPPTSPAENTPGAPSPGTP